jgi:hypothetical protein
LGGWERVPLQVLLKTQAEASSSSHDRQAALLAWGSFPLGSEPALNDAGEAANRACSANVTLRYRVTTLLPKG